MLMQRSYGATSESQGKPNSRPDIKVLAVQNILGSNQIIDHSGRTTLLSFQSANPERANTSFVLSPLSPVAVTPNLFRLS